MSVDLLLCPTGAAVALAAEAGWWLCAGAECIDTSTAVFAGWFPCACTGVPGLLACAGAEFVDTSAAVFAAWLLCGGAEAAVDTPAAGKLVAVFVCFMCWLSNIAVAASLALALAEVAERGGAAGTGSARCGVGWWRTGAGAVAEPFD